MFLGIVCEILVLFVLFAVWICHIFYVRLFLTILLVEVEVEVEYSVQRVYVWVCGQ